MTIHPSEKNMTPEDTSSQKNETSNDVSMPTEPTETNTAQESSTPPSGEKSQGASSLWKKVGIVSGATMLSRILGLLRDMVFGALFSRFATDAFSIAFLIPNLLRRLLAEGIISTAFIPVFTGYAKQEETEKQQTYGAVFVVFSLVLLLFTVLGIVFSPWIVPLFASGFEASKLQFTIELTQLMFPFLFLVGLTSFWVALLNIKHHFAAPALGPVFLNLGIIACAVSLRFFFPESRAVLAMAWGVLVGGVFQLALQIWAARRERIVFHPHWNPKHPAIQETSSLMMPTLLGLGVYQLNLLISNSLASYLPTGSVTYIYYSNRLMELPLGVFAVAFATVNLPTLAAQAESKDWSAFQTTLERGMRGVLFLCIPAAFGLFLLREPIIMTLFQRGRFVAADTLATAQVFGPAAFGLIFAGMLRNLTPAFYAIKDTRTPVQIAGMSLILNASLSVLFGFILDWKATGLTLANTCSTLGSVMLCLYFMQHRFPYTFKLPLWNISLPLLVVSIAMSLVLWAGMYPFLWQSVALLPRLGLLFGLIAVGSGVFALGAWLLNIPEMTAISRRLKQRLRRRSQ